jgi:hypothetical protein
MGGSRGLRIGFEDIILISLFFANAFKNDLHFLNRIRRESNIVIPWLLFLFICLLSNINSGLPLSGIGLIIEMIRCFAIFIFAINYFTTEKRVLIGIGLLAVTVGIQGLVSIFQYMSSSLIPGLQYLGQHDDLYQEGWLPSSQIRPGGTLGGPNDLAGYIVMLLPVIISFILYKRRSWSWLCVAISIMLGMTGLILTFSRGGWVSLVIALMIYGILYIRRGYISNKITAIIFLSCILSIGVLYNYPLIKLRLFSEDYGSSSSRVPLMIDSLNVIKNNPYIGVGINNYSAVISKYDTTGVYVESSFRGGEYPVHNMLLLHFAELGIAGGLIFCWLWLACFQEVFRCCFIYNRFHSIVAIGVFSGMFGQFLIYQVHWGYFESYLPFWVILSLCIGLKEISYNNRIKIIINRK